MLSQCNTILDRSNREQTKHGTASFPIACYHDDLAREAVPWHWHDEVEAFVVSEGAAVVTMGTENCVVRTGEGIFINAGVLHSCEAFGADGSRLHSLVFHSRLVGGSVESVFHQKYVLPVTENRAFPGIHLRRDVPWQAALAEEIEGAWQDCVAESPCFELRVRDRLSRLLAGLGAHLASMETPGSPRALRNGERIKAMLQFIMDHYGEEITNADIARSASVSESECLRCFRATIGSTPIRYLREYRVEQAAQRLISTEMPVGEIAARCGFLDASYFTKTFRELKGATPGEYRRVGRRSGG